MKTTIIRGIALPLAATLMAIHLFGQKTDGNNEVAKFSYAGIVSKTGLTIKSETSVPYNEKVFKEFHKRFYDVDSAYWEVGHNGSYLASFLEGGHSNAILFNKDGKIIYLINYLSEDQLPPDIKNLALDNHDEFKITSAARISENNRAVWIINLTGLNHHIRVKVEDGVMEEINKFKLAN